MALHDKPPIPPIVSLRRYGDILVLLPLLYWLSEKQKAPVTLVVHRAFAPLLDGVSYVNPIIFDGDMDDPMAAVKLHNGVNAQVRGRGLVVDHSRGDFAKKSWELAGYVWNRHMPLVIDQRDEKREKLLAKEVFKTDLPRVLVKLNSFSSPFADADNLRRMIDSEFGKLAEVVNLDLVNGERVYDILGLMDRASCMISTDTATLWLAKASKCPVIALVNPARFLASPPSGNVIARLPYNQAIAKWDTIARAIHSTLLDLGGDSMVLAFSEYTPTLPDEIRRNNAARATWPLLEARLLPVTQGRTSKLIGDTRSMHFVRDMIDLAFSTGSENIAVITNNDIKVDARLGNSIRRSCAKVGCWFAYRIEEPGKPTDEGADLFAMTRHWWAVHRHLFPDMLIGYWWWDDLMVRIMRWSGCLEQERLYYHEPHPAATVTRMESPGMEHNNRLAMQWQTEHHEGHAKPALAWFSKL